MHRVHGNGNMAEEIITTPRCNVHTMHADTYPYPISNLEIYRSGIPPSPHPHLLPPPPRPVCGGPGMWFGGVLLPMVGLAGWLSLLLAGWLAGRRAGWLAGGLAGGLADKC